VDRHHIMFPAQEWSLRPEAKKIRSTPALIPKIDREDHNEIHRHVPFVPMLGYYALRRVASDFYPQRTTLATIDELLFSMESAKGHPKSHPIETAQIELSMQALEAERDLLRGIIVPSGTILVG